METVLIQAWFIDQKIAELKKDENPYDAFICYTIDEVFKELKFIAQNAKYKSVTISKCIMLWEEAIIEDGVVGKVKA